jgi:DNA-binding transcriptional LysR family regulator
MVPRAETMQLASIELFCRAAEAGSFTAAAESLGLTPAAVSRSVARLEQRLGVRLFARTTRQVALTDEGRLYHAHCTQALAQLQEAAQALSGRQAVPQGLLRISLPTTYAHHRVLPVLPRFQARHPGVQIELQIANRNVDFVDDGYDVAVRGGEPRDSRLVARKLEDASFGVFASPAYLRRHGRPKTPHELPAHRCIQFVMPSTGRPLPWLFVDRGREIDVEVAPSLRVIDDVLGCLGHARAGGGLCQTYHFVAQEAVARGELVELLQPYAGRSRPFCVLYPTQRQLSARVRAFVDFLVQELAPPAKRRRAANAAPA